MSSMSDSGAQGEGGGLKLATARTLKWNAIDRVASQLLYAGVGIVLANVLSKEDFGLVGALVVFQAFAILFVDSGFGAALLQKKNPDDRDYSTVFWFNLAVSVAVYLLLWLAAPAIAAIFQGDERLIPLSKVMFLTFVINGLSIVQTNRLMKRMDVKQIAIANTVALVVSGVLGVCLALGGFGPWALVWQSVANAAVKTAWLWVTGHWRPAGFSIDSLKGMWRLGLSVFSSSMLNTLFLNVYSFVIGAFYSLSSLGVYSQADKWSKMGSASLSQVLTSSFVPLLARVQDSPADFHRYMKKANRFTAFVTLPAMAGLAVGAAPLFHLLFGHKWDAAIPLFQILAVRGIFVVMISLAGNYLLALGRGKLLMVVEAVKDGFIALAILATVFALDMTLLVWGQLFASVATVAVVGVITARATGYGFWRSMSDMAPFALVAAAMTAGCMLLLELPLSPLLSLLVVASAGALFYAGILAITKTPELREAASYLFGRFIKRR